MDWKQRSREVWEATEVRRLLSNHGHCIEAAFTVTTRLGRYLKLEYFCIVVWLLLLKCMFWILPSVWACTCWFTALWLATKQARTQSPPLLIPYCCPLVVHNDQLCPPQWLLAGDGLSLSQGGGVHKEWCPSLPVCVYRIHAGVPLGCIRYSMFPKPKSLGHLSSRLSLISNL